MGDSTLGEVGLPKRSMRDWFSGGLVGFAGGVALCTAFGTLLALHAWKNPEPDRARSELIERLFRRPQRLRSSCRRIKRETRSPFAGTKSEKRPVEPAACCENRRSRAALTVMDTKARRLRSSDRPIRLL